MKIAKFGCSYCSAVFQIRKDFFEHVIQEHDNNEKVSFENEHKEIQEIHRNKEQTRNVYEKDVTSAETISTNKSKINEDVSSKDNPSKIFQDFHHLDHEGDEGLSEDIVNNVESQAIEARHAETTNQNTDGFIKEETDEMYFSNIMRPNGEHTDLEDPTEVIVSLENIIKEEKIDTDFVDLDNDKEFLQSIESEENLTKSLELELAGCIPKHKCKICGKSFKVKLSFNEHICNGSKAKRKSDQNNVQRKNSNQELVFHCTFCPRKFDIIWRLKYHERLRHIKMFELKCEFCGKEFRAVHNLTNHLLSLHHKSLESELGTTIPKQHKCAKCENSFDSNQSLNKHFCIKHEPKQPICQPCGKQFRDLTRLKSHEYSAHGKESDVVGEYTCSDCGKEFPLKNGLYNHIRNIHKPFTDKICQLCGKQFRNLYRLKSHEYSAHGKESDVVGQYACSDCGKEFPLKDALYSHIRNIHKPITDGVSSCVECGKQYNTIAQLKMHAKSHSEKHTCDECGSSFRHSISLKSHISIKHRGEINFKCDTCEKGFTSDPSLKKHIAIKHRGERNFKCDTCEKGFTRYTSLKQHEKLHTTKSKPFQCTYCDIFYGEKRNVLNHVTTKHPEESISFKKQTIDGEFKIVTG